MTEGSSLSYDKWQNLPAMFFDVAERVADRPLFVVQTRRPMVFRLRGGGGQTGRRACRFPGLDRHRTRRPGDAGRGKPAGMGDRRPRHHGRRRDHGARLRHQPGRRPPARDVQQRCEGADRLHAGPRRVRVVGRRRNRRARFGDHDRAARRAGGCGPCRLPLGPRRPRPASVPVRRSRPRSLRSPGPRPRA